MTTSKVLDRISKLIALSSNNTNEAEAATALAKARQLLLDHGLSMNEVEAHAEAKAEATESFVAEVASPTMKKPEAWKRYLATIIADYTMTRAIISTLRYSKEFRIRFIGAPENIASAAFIYSEFIQMIPSMGAQAYKTWSSTPAASYASVGRKAWIRHYAIGFIEGLATQLDDLTRTDTPEVTALIVASESRINDYLAVNYPTLGEARAVHTPLDLDAYGLGALDGATAEVPTYTANRLT